ncbi:helix-turn-helix transcriptional regulator [Nitrosomonas communis]|uniref:S24 family peptidase n=1 Tax=Nitrosomonas communis TaxID=44574 RepID=UPI0026EC5604|nr:S24 family peptidase [Nitrosomonas communis]MCO6427540.1 helix-turn-helix transcriptional regulator [Nitrosomonas communis]
MKTNDEIRLDRLRILVDEAGGINEFANQIGKQYAQVSQWLNQSVDPKTGRKRSMSDDTVRNIETICKKPRGWMDQPIPEEGELAEVVYISSGERMGADKDSASFKMLDVKADCGDGATNSDYPETIKTLVMSLEEAHRLIGSTNKNGHIKIIIANKDSMIPTIQQGDLLFIDTSVKEYAGEAVYILLHGGEVVCKRLSLVGKTLTVSSDNTAYPSWPWDERTEQTRIIGKVIPVLWRKIDL